MNLYKLVIKFSKLHNCALFEMNILLKKFYENFLDNAFALNVRDKKDFHIILFVLQKYWNMVNMMK